VEVQVIAARREPENTLQGAAEEATRGFPSRRRLEGR